jgi:Tol biopolymer transport system component
MFERRGYTAEASWSPDGRHVLYAQVDPEKSRGLGRPDADLFVFDAKTETHTPLVVADGYDGGPFFSPDGRWICYRSDRRGDNLLQLFIAELAFDDAEDPGRITGIEREVQLTDNRHVNWAPYWHSSGDFLVYTTSRLGHFNYEVFALPVFGDDGSVLKDAGHARVTEASGFDGLPVFSPDGRYLMWTSQRGDSGSSQVWIAEVQEGGWSDLMSRGGGDR